MALPHYYYCSFGSSCHVSYALSPLETKCEDRKGSGPYSRKTLTSSVNSLPLQPWAHGQSYFPLCLAIKFTVQTLDYHSLWKHLYSPCECLSQLSLCTKISLPIPYLVSSLNSFFDVISTWPHWVEGSLSLSLSENHLTTRSSLP
jgi:hypothetical protein